MASSVFVEMDSPALMRLIDELLTPPLHASVYVVAFLAAIVFHNGSYEIKSLSSLSYHIAIIAYNRTKALSAILPIC